MKVSTRGRYATCALICMAEEYGKGPVTLGKISQEQSISVKYLENIMNLLIKPGIVKSSKGKGGGFVLAKDPEHIMMGDVVAATEGVVMPVHCIEDSSKCPRYRTCPAKYMWKGLQESMFEELNSTTLLSLVKKKKELALELKKGKRKNRKPAKRHK